MVSLTVDQLQHKAHNGGGITMDEFGSLLRMGLDNRGRNFGTEMDGTTLFHNESNWAYRELDKMADEMIVALKRAGPFALTEIFYARDKLKPVIDFIIKNRSDDLTSKEFLSLYTIDGLMARRRKVVEMARTYRADAVKDTFDPTPSNAGILDTMYKYDKGPRPRHWEKNSKKKQLAATA